MTELEKQQFAKEIEESILSKLKGTVIREDTGDVLRKTRKKWFINSQKGWLDSLMHKTFGSYIYAAVWDCIRKLTCYICGTSYVRNIEDIDFANEVAEILCQTVYDLAVKYREKENSPAADQSKRGY